MSSRATGEHGTVGEVFRAFLLLGMTSFGGPVAHLGYFRDAFVVRRRWLSESAYADLVALCQFLPGPASSQVGMAIGLRRAGYAGMAAAWVAFTLPSAVLLVAFALGVQAVGVQPGAGWLLGLKVAAVAVVAHAVVGMARSLASGKRQATIAVVALVLVLLLPSALSQVAVILLGGVLGLVWLNTAESTDVDRAEDGPSVSVGRRTALTFPTSSHTWPIPARRGVAATAWSASCSVPCARWSPEPATCGRSASGPTPHPSTPLSDWAVGSPARPWAHASRRLRPPSAVSCPPWTPRP